jgi:hypothetical protein
MKTAYKNLPQYSTVADVGVTYTVQKERKPSLAWDEGRLLRLRNRMQLIAELTNGALVECCGHEARPFSFLTPIYFFAFRASIEANS